MTWDEIIAALSSIGELVVVGGRGCSLIVPSPGRLQRVAVKRRGDDELVLLAQVCSVRHVPALEALQYNAHVERWALALKREAYVLQRTLALAALDRARLLDEVVAMTGEAARIHRRQVAPAVDDETQRLRSYTFAHWCD